MNPNTWESHLELRDDPTLEGAWGETPWGFYTYDYVIPDDLSVRTSMCVPVCSLDPHNPQVTLTLNLERGGYEIPGGHLDPLRDGTLESAAMAAARETEEETGLKIPAEDLIPYGYIEVKNTDNNKYPELSYMQFFGAHTAEMPGDIIDPKVDGAGVFTLNALRRMETRGAVRSTELQLVCHGIRAVLMHKGLPYEHIRVQ